MVFLAPANILRVRGRRARRLRETPRRAHARTPVGARRVRLLRKAAETVSTKSGKQRRLESQPKHKQDEIGSERFARSDREG